MSNNKTSKNIKSKENEKNKNKNKVKENIKDKVKDNTKEIVEDKKKENTKGNSKESSNEDNAVSQKTLHKNMSFTARERYKMLRTNLNFTLPDTVGCPVIGVTSSIRGEGKSTTAVNLAYVLAEENKRVVLIDADLRLPSIAKKMGLKSTPGLTNLLVEDNSQNIVAYKSSVLENWRIIPSGDIPPNPSELLSSEKMGNFIEKLKQYCDYIVIDLPPVNVVTDALAISKYLSGMILVVRENYTDKADLDDCVRSLELSNVNVLGFLLNAVVDETGSYGKYTKYGKYGRFGKYYKYGKYYRNKYFKQGYCQTEELTKINISENSEESGK